MYITHIKLNGIEHRAPCKQIFCLYTYFRPPGWGQKGQNIFSESRHVAYQINGAKSTMLAHILFLHTFSTPGVGSKRLFTENSHVTYQIKGNGT